MTQSPWSRQIAALTPYIRGTTIEITGPEPGLLAGTVSIRGADGTDEWDSLPDDSADGIVALGAPGALQDPVAEVGHWRRVLREGGTLAVITAQHGPPSWLASLMHHLGGLELTSARALDSRDGPWLLVAERRAVAEVRSPLGTLGPRLAEIASRDQDALAELYFQFGTILLQSGDPTMASECFSKLQNVEGRSADGMFGRGMCHATAERWTEAIADLEQAHRLDPNNDQIERWLTLVRARSQAIAAPTVTAAPVATPTPASS